MYDCIIYERYQAVVFQIFPNKKVFLETGDDQSQDFLSIYSLILHYPAEGRALIAEILRVLAIIAWVIKY